MAQNHDFLRIKTFEFLFNLTQSSPEAFSFFRTLTRNHKPLLIEVMEQHYAKNLTLPEFAERAGRSLSAFKRDFSSAFGQPPATWIKKRRLQLAHRLMQKTGRAPTEVYLEVGFEDLGHFSRSFKKEFGFLPSALKSRSLP